MTSHSTRRRALAGRKLARMTAAVACATAVGLLPVLAAHADDGDRSERDHGYDHRDERGRSYQHRHHYGDGEGRGYEQQRWHTRHYHPIYAPPPVYYHREESPGVSVFIPWDLR